MHEGIATPNVPDSRSLTRARSGVELAMSPFYSVRRAFIGEMVAARAAGIIAAMKADSTNEPPATPSASGSQNFTP